MPANGGTNMANRKINRGWPLACFGLVALMASPALAGGTYTELYNFDCANDGCNPNEPALLAQGEDGVLYSTLQSGTSGSQHGSIMAYTPGGGEETLYRFGGGDGFHPNSGLTL